MWGEEGERCWGEGKGGNRIRDIDATITMLRKRCGTVGMMKVVL